MKAGSKDVQEQRLYQQLQGKHDGFIVAVRRVNALVEIFLDGSVVYAVLGNILVFEHIPVPVYRDVDDVALSEMSAFC